MTDSAIERSDIDTSDGWTVRPKTLPPLPKRAEMLPAVPRRGASAQLVLDCVAEAYGVTLAGLLKRDRHRTIAEARGVACWILRAVNGLSYPEIGRAIGRDHTTTMTAIRKVLRRREEERDFETFTEALLAAVAARVETPK